MVAMASETVITGTSIERATRSAVRWRVPGLAGGDGRPGTRCTLARAMREASRGQDDGPVHLGQLGEPLGAELGVEQEAAGADGEHRRVVAHHDQGAPLGLEDPVEPVPQRRARGHERQRLDQRLAAVRRPRWHGTRRQERRNRRGLAVARGVLLPAQPAARRPTALGHAVPPARTAIPGRPGGRRAGTSARVKPSRAASARRCPTPGHLRGPRRPARPRRRRPGRPGRATPARAEATARASGRSAAGSATRTPPVAETNSSTGPSSIPARHSRTAAPRRQPARVDALDAAPRRAAGRRRRRPGPGARPAGAAGPRAPGPPRFPAPRPAGRPRSSGPGPPRPPGPTTPSRRGPPRRSAPNRCFTARRSRSEWCRSPSKATTCRPGAPAPAARPGRRPWSRGPPARAACPSALASPGQAVHAGPHLADGPRRRRRRPGSTSVWIESTTTSAGSERRPRPPRPRPRPPWPSTMRLGRAPGRAARRGPHLGAPTPRPRPAAPVGPAGPPPPAPGAQGGLADPGSPRRGSPTRPAAPRRAPGRTRGPRWPGRPAAVGIDRGQRHRARPASGRPGAGGPAR